MFIVHLLTTWYIIVHTIFRTSIVFLCFDIMIVHKSSQLKFFLTHYILYWYKWLFWIHMVLYLTAMFVFLIIFYVFLCTIIAIWSYIYLTYVAHHRIKQMKNSEYFCLPKKWNIFWGIVCPFTFPKFFLFAFIKVCVFCTCIFCTHMFVYVYMCVRTCVCQCMCVCVDVEAWSWLISGEFFDFCPSYSLRKGLSTASSAL